MRVVVLGAAAGGGSPQWNCNCPTCARVRGGDAAALPRTQVSVAVSADGERWVLLNASPDLPYQLRAHEILHPAGAGRVRHSPLRAVVLSGGDVDCIAGLLSLRESQPLSIYAGAHVQAVIEGNQIFHVLNREIVQFLPLPPGAEVALQEADGTPLGLTVRAFPVPGKIPLYQETSGDPRQFGSATAVIGLSLTGPHGRRLVYIPGCAQVTQEVRREIEGAALLFFDGTLWEDDEMIRAGAGTKTGQRMGHISISGPDGSMAALAGVAAARRVFIHVNNTNPVLCADSPQAAAARAAGWEIAYDGMEFKL